MIMNFLDDRLPVELTDIIYNRLHRSIMKEVCCIINHKIVFVMVHERMSFLICETQNYYRDLVLD